VENTGHRCQQKNQFHNKPIKMKIYIASSWKNQHAVEMLTKLLREKGHEVISWVENNYGENHNHVTKRFDFETWVKSPESDQSFKFDTEGAMFCDLFVYLGPAGKDAAAECGMAYAMGKPMIALWEKGEDFGLMRKMFGWTVGRFHEVLEIVEGESIRIMAQSIDPDDRVDF
jgi:nucleoside 2-deoxyribosyltransferase